MKITATAKSRLNLLLSAAAIATLLLVAAYIEHPEYFA